MSYPTNAATFDIPMLPYQQLPYWYSCTHTRTQDSSSPDLTLIGIAVHIYAEESGGAVILFAMNYIKHDLIEKRATSLPYV